MSRADAEMALERHATSKLRQLSDLQAIATHGIPAIDLVCVNLYEFEKVAARKDVQRRMLSLAPKSAKARMKGPT